MSRPLDFQDYQVLQPFQQGGNFQFGFETEFLRLVNCFAYYTLAPGVGVPQWESLGKEAKEQALLSYCRSLQHGDRRVVLEPTSGPDFLKPLHRDDTGNVELALGPFADFQEFSEQLHWVQQELGEGSLQAMVSLPSPNFFGSNPTQGALEHLGWFNFFNELDILERLERGLARWRSKPIQEPLRSFLHPYLGPMITLRHRLLKKFLRENAKGEMLDPESLIRPGRRDHSFKYVGSTAYRPDVAAPHRICWEIRDAHRDLDLLLNRVARVVFYGTKDRSAFLAFAEIPPFDSAEAFSALPSEVREWLVATCPNRAPPIALEFEKAKFTYEVYRNFAYPLRSWNPWLELLGPEFSSQVQAAQNSYLQKLEKARQQNSLLLAQGALVEFSEESGLYELFRKREKKIVEGLQ